MHRRRLKKRVINIPAWVELKTMKASEVEALALRLGIEYKNRNQAIDAITDKR